MLSLVAAPASPALSATDKAAMEATLGQSVFNTLLVKRGGKWLIMMGQNTPVDARAVAANPTR